ncbi:MAG: DUF1080 domain-containing protein [Candidatus Solibacter sp.]
MKLTNTFLIAGALGALALLVTPRASSQQQPPAPAAGAPGAFGAGRGGRGAQPIDYADNEGWVSLFDGQTLNGWDGDPRFWSVKDSAIYVQATCEKPTGTIYLVWQGGEPADFQLKWESKTTGNDNAGIQYRSYITSAGDVAFKYPGRGGGGTLGRGAAAAAPGGAGAPGGPGRGGAGRGPGGGRGPQCANPGTPPSAAERAKWDMSGPQFDFDAANQYSGQYYEQLGRGIVASPGQVVLAEEGKPRRLLGTIADKATLDSWFKKDDYNQYLLVAKGNTHSMFMNGHLISVFIDSDPGYFRAAGKIGIETENLGELYTRNIWLKRLN